MLFFSQYTIHLAKITLLKLYFLLPLIAKKLFLIIFLQIHLWLEVDLFFVVERDRCKKYIRLKDWKNSFPLSIEFTFIALFFNIRFKAFFTR